MGEKNARLRDAADKRNMEIQQSCLMVFLRNLNIVYTKCCYGYKQYVTLAAGEKQEYTSEDETGGRDLG